LACLFAHVLPSNLVYLHYIAAAPKKQVKKNIKISVLAIDNNSHTRYNHRHREQTTSQHGYIQGGIKNDF
jgi:hypothetical protein